MLIFLLKMLINIIIDIERCNLSSILIKTPITPYLANASP